MRVELSTNAEEVTISLNLHDAKLLFSTLESISRREDKMTGEELGLAKVLSDELEYYILNSKELETIDYINDSYK